jgi:hypothetical protein
LPGFGLSWADEIVSVHWVAAQFQVMVEFWVMVKVIEVPEPVDGTEPVPLQPVQV